MSAIYGFAKPIFGARKISNNKISGLIINFPSKLSTYKLFLSSKYKRIIYFTEVINSSLMRMLFRIRKRKLAK